MLEVKTEVFTKLGSQRTKDGCGWQSAQHIEPPLRYLVASYISFVVYVIGIPLFLGILVLYIRKENMMANARVLLRM